MSDHLSTFLATARPSLKICGVRSGADAERLAGLGVEALGINFWPASKRFCDPEAAAGFLPGLAGRILRVGVFVNPEPAAVRDLLDRRLLDLLQFHGDESLPFCRQFEAPFVKAIGVENPDSLDGAAFDGARGILLDAHAPGAYGGTGETIDWALAANFIRQHPELPVILAGGITPDNAAEALDTVRPAALDVASGAESAPGVKDFAKVEALLEATRSAPGR
ncbi:MAG: phosphoribosylanthranilate isomerase [Akkermansiaceae bacterium]|nr:phosphoribosylanthranilate isomerase [Akkermansiaceae bacterium]